MSNNSFSLDEIIQQSKQTMRGRGGSFRGGRGANRGVPKGVQNKGIVKNNRGNLRTTITRGRGGQVITDARFKIIEKNRLKMTDARDKLAEIAKQTDARLKLDKLRASQFKKDVPLRGILRKTGRSGRITLTTNKNIMQGAQGMGMQFGQNTQGPTFGSSLVPNEPHFMNDMNYFEPPPLRRTVNNEYAPTPPPPPPVFNFKPPGSPYSWKRTDHSGFSNHWDFPGKTRSIAPITLDNKYYDSRNPREMSAKSRLDSMSMKPGPMAIIGRTKPHSGPSPTTGYRIIVSNLQSNVTQEDIKELFEDVGELLVSRLVRTGVAEVIYKTMKDAMKAVETYHNRQLDGHPMKCLLVNQRPKNSPAISNIRAHNENRRGSNSSYVQPSLGAVHRALFDD